MYLEIKENKLILPGAQVEFKYKIYDRILVSDCIIVMLDVSPESDEVNNIHAVSIKDGKILWTVQPVNEAFPDISQTSPYVGMKLLENGNISATNWVGMNYEISVKDGKILSSNLAK